FSHFPRAFFEFFDALAETAGQVRDPLGAEQQEDGKDHNDPFPTAKETCNHDFHKIKTSFEKLRPLATDSKASKVLADGHGRILTRFMKQAAGSRLNPQPGMAALRSARFQRAGFGIFQMPFPIKHILTRRPPSQLFSAAD